MLNYGGCWIAIKACSANVKTEGLSELLTTSTASVRDGLDDTEEKEIQREVRVLFDIQTSVYRTSTAILEYAD